jgi:hypothetical protein
MRETKDIMRVVGIVLLGLFLLVVGVPLVFAAAGITLSLIFGLAVALIKLAIVAAVVYLILVGIRTLLR